MRVRTVWPILVASLALSTAAFAQTDYESWPLLKNPFPSTGGNGVMIDKYDPVVANGKCTTDFTAIVEGKPYYNEVVFDAVAVQGGILCTNGKWRAKDGSADGTTPFEVFIKDGITRARPQ
ncbi:MAG: hypothetical protein KF750_10810 [Xanthobacteraceae bacterium]|nr:hypothetical protein [Xanthobacteraceae bacterium]